MPLQNYLITKKISTGSALFLLNCICLLLTSANQHPGDGHAGLLISEVYYDTPGIDADEEWIELVNVSDNEIDLSSFKIGDEERRGGGEGMMSFPEVALILSGETIIIAQTSLGFESLYGLIPDYEIQDSSTAVPDLQPHNWSTGDIRLANDGDEVLILDEMDNVVDIVAFGDSTFIDPDHFTSQAVVGVFRGQSIERVPIDCDTNSAAEWQPTWNPTPWIVTYIGGCQSIAALEPTGPIPIGIIQGEDRISPYTSQRVSMEGIVTGVREDQNEEGTVFYSFFLQDLPGAEDGNPLTSDGVSVFAGIDNPHVSVGDIISIQGAVIEYYGLTEISDENLSIAIRSRGNTLPEPEVLNPPSERIRSHDYFEKYEGMLVDLPPAIVIGPAHKGCGFEVVRMDLGIDHFHHNINEGQMGRIIHVLYPSDVDCSGMPSVNAGDIITGLEGPLSFEFEEFKLVYQEPDSLSIEARTPSVDWEIPAVDAEEISIVSFNMDDFLGYSERVEEADSTGSTANDARIMKFTHVIGPLLNCPTIIGIQEVGDAQMLADLAQSVESACGFLYENSHIESVDKRGIDVALMTDPRRIIVDGFTLMQTCTDLVTDIEDDEAACPDGTRPLFARPPLQAQFTADGVTITIFVNHFKSKRGGEGETAAIRRNQAIHLSNLVRTTQVETNDGPAIVLGDFNDYVDSTAMEILTTDAGLVDVLKLVPESQRYSYIFGGRRQLVDWILVSADLAARTSKADILHVNADFAENLRFDISSQFLPFRSSDHDIPLIVLSPGDLNQGQTASQDTSSDNDIVGQLIVESVKTLLTEMGQKSASDILRGCMTLFSVIVRGFLQS